MPKKKDRKRYCGQKGGSKGTKASRRTNRDIVQDVIAKKYNIKRIMTSLCKREEEVNEIKLDIAAGLRSSFYVLDACEELLLILALIYPFSSKKCKKGIRADVARAFESRMHGQWGLEYLWILQQLEEVSKIQFTRKQFSDMRDIIKSAFTVIKKREAESYDHPAPYLPEEVLVQVFSYMDPKTLARSSCVCKLWKANADNDVLWYNIVKYSISDNIGDIAFHDISEGETWKEKFKVLHTRHKGFFPCYGCRTGCICCLRVSWNSLAQDFMRHDVERVQHIRPFSACPRNHGPLSSLEAVEISLMEFSTNIAVVGDHAHRQMYVWSNSMIALNEHFPKLGLFKH